MRIAYEIRVENLAISATCETRLKSTCGLNCPNRIIVKQTPFDSWNVTIIASVIPNAFSLS